MLRTSWLSTIRTLAAAREIEREFPHVRRVFRYYVSTVSDRIVINAT